VILSRIRDNFESVNIINTAGGAPRLSLGDEPDPHLWLSPVIMKIVAANICNALILADTTHHSLYRANYEALMTDLDDADRQIRDILEPVRGSVIIVFHPSYGYFTNAYGLGQRSIETEGADPGPKHLAELIDYAKSNKITTIFIQPQFSPSSARTVAVEIGAELVVLDPLARDYLVNLIHMARTIRKSFDK
jgi:zinc transport system substrate-binding protein